MKWNLLFILIWKSENGSFKHSIKKFVFTIDYFNVHIKIQTMALQFKLFFIKICYKNTFLIMYNIDS